MTDSSIHKYFMNKYRWYRNWHQFRYVNYVHFILLFAIVGFDCYLAYQLKLTIGHILI